RSCRSRPTTSSSRWSWRSRTPRRRSRTESGAGRNRRWRRAIACSTYGLVLFRDRDLVDDALDSRRLSRDVHRVRTFGSRRHLTGQGDNPLRGVDVDLQSWCAGVAKELRLDSSGDGRVRGGITDVLAHFLGLVRSALTAGGRDLRRRWWHLRAGCWRRGLP